ncbi:MAG: NUDIX hydrolase [Clostridia bacterium]|nr:NUDIX hydrolase [Clostridia bacterium]
MHNWIRQIEEFVPRDEREEAERQIILELAKKEGDRLLFRESAFAHLTASSIILNRERTRTLMVWHNIYRSWSWTGGHCDGDPDFEAVSRREATEETGIRTLRRIGSGIASVEILPVWAHVKREKTVGSHLHLNVSYLFEADETETLRTAPEENSGVRWLETGRIEEYCTEPDMIPVYKRLFLRANV